MAGASASSLRMGDELVLLRDGGAISGAPRELAASGEHEVREFLGADGEAYLKSVSITESVP